MNDDDYDSDVDETENEKHGSGNGIVEKGRTGHLTTGQSRKKWSCFNFGRLATTGKVWRYR